MTEYTPEKNIWTHNDFDGMGWHDATIYGFTIEKGDNEWAADLVFDIDYIFDWVDPAPPEKSFTFWVAPCTLIFKGCFDLNIDLGTNGLGLDFLEIADLNLKSKFVHDDNLIYEWELELQQGLITFKSHGFDQIVRKQPLHVKQQLLTLEERGGINFARH